MFRKLAALLALTSAFALAGGGASPTPFGGTIQPSDTKTWRCQSGRTLVSLAHNNEFLRIFYQGHNYVLRPVASKLDMSGIIQYSNFGAAHADRWLVWIIHTQKPNSVELFQVMQNRSGQQQRVMLEDCWRS